MPGQGNCAFPTDRVIELQSRGVTPVIWWQPTNAANPLQGYYERYDRTLHGFHDAYITQWARDAKAAGQATGKPIILRYAHEATGYWFPWSVGRFDNTKENYKAAWRYVWKIFEREGALPYVRFMWSTVFPYKWAYPGDKYVKFVGITVLNFGADRSWRTPGPLIDKRVVASAKFTKRPIIIAEMATAYLGGDKAQWLKQAYKGSYEKHPSIWGIMYLDTDEPNVTAAQPDWRLIKPDDGSAHEHVPHHRLVEELPGPALPVAAAGVEGAAPRSRAALPASGGQGPVQPEHEAHQRAQRARRPRLQVLAVEALVRIDDGLPDPSPRGALLLREVAR